MERRGLFLSLGGIAACIGGTSALKPIYAADEDSDGRQLADVARLYQLQAAFHLAKSTQNIDLLMSLWDANGSLTIKGDPNSPYVGLDRLRSFLLGTGSFTHHRLSLVPSFKIQIEVHENEAFFYEECHDISDFNLPSRSIAADTYLAGVVRKFSGKWLFSNMFGGAAPLSVDHYYFP